MGLFSKSVHSLDTSMDTAPVDTKSKRAFSLRNSLRNRSCATLKSIVFGAYLTAYQSSAYRETSAIGCQIKQAFSVATSLATYAVETSGQHFKCHPFTIQTRMGWSS